MSLCHSIHKGEVEHMSVTVNIDTERGALFHSCWSPQCKPLTLAAPSNALPTIVVEVEIQCLTFG